VETRKPEEIELGLKTIEKLTKVSIPDKTDKAWLEERNRLITYYQHLGKSKEWINETLKASPPLGREQRKKKVTVADEMIHSMRNTKTMLKAIATEMNQSANLSAKSRADHLQALTKLVQTQEALTKIFTNPDSTKDLDTVLSGVGTVHWSNFGFKSQYIDKTEYIANRGEVSLCVMLNSTALGLTYERSVVGISGQPIYINSVHSAFQKGGNDIVLDLADNTMKRAYTGDVKSEPEVVESKSEETYPASDDDDDTKTLSPTIEPPPV
jgi:hypothetical protein